VADLEKFPTGLLGVLLGDFDPAPFRSQFLSTLVSAVSRASDMIPAEVRPFVLPVPIRYFYSHICFLMYHDSNECYFCVIQEPRLSGLFRSTLTAEGRRYNYEEAYLRRVERLKIREKLTFVLIWLPIMSSQAHTVHICLR
jgi:hypothetical protein